MKTVKVIKALVAAAMLAAVAGAFFGAPTSLACRIQPAPTVAFLAVLLLSPLVGRLFCECFCPLGVIQSAVSWLLHPRTKVRRVCTRLPETRAQQTVRWTVLAVSAALVATGFGAVGWALTPYSIFGKALTLFAPGVALFAAVVILAAFGKGRVWCNWICPAGTLFCILSKKSVLAHRVGPGCAGCRACFARGGSAAPAKAAPQSGPGADGDGVTRRDAIKGVAVLAAVEAAEKTTDGGYALVSLPGSPDRSVPALPPGAADRAEFNVKCVACGLCIANCRGGCLSASTDLRRFGQPEMDFRRGYCLPGCSMKCAAVCPAGAIRPPEGVPRRDIHVGHAVWRRELCIRETEGVECTACSRKCPVGAIHIVEGFPVVDRDACIGCGACEHVCPARPMPAVFVKGFERQRAVRPFDESDLLAEMKSLLERGEASCVAARDGVIVGRASGNGVAPALRLLDEGRLARALVADRVIGRAAAAIMLAGGARRVHALVMGADARAMLAAAGVACTADRVVPRILNRDLTDGCPMEQTVEGVEDPAEMVAALRSRLRL